MPSVSFNDFRYHELKNTLYVSLKNVAPKMFYYSPIV